MLERVKSVATWASHAASLVVSVPPASAVSVSGSVGIRPCRLLRIMASILAASMTDRRR
jgi:hypothetical protein